MAASWRTRLGAAVAHPLAKPAVAALLLAPAGWLAWAAANDALGANPAETLIRDSGEMALKCLLLALAVTPLRELTGIAALARLRRLLGLLAFTWGLLHLGCYAWLDQGLDVAAVLRDIGKRPFILVGTLALGLMLPLAATSFNAAIRALGAARWKALHRTVYAIGPLALLHFLWMRSGKGVYDEVVVYGTLMAVVLGWRLRGWVLRRLSGAAGGAR